ncbi:ATP-binding cassette domain-containing protein [Trueperella pyogenes]|uniref:ATP-binding cassette domain-containing protein n=1 Tax=Trueperella pyogenes TaxID=1661 RepID=UPI0024C0202C|nr:ATP-binding cassette domain-containing protein [Trueperella pyogenes]WHU60688.1 ATP-binding cassette domain-containing protein [Trueperella pyogenes]
MNSDIDESGVRSPVGSIEIRGVTTHNLRDVTVRIPKHELVGIAGVSGSGKSSLVSTLAAGAQQAVSALFPAFVRAKMKTLALGQVDNLQGLTFTAIVGQKKFSRNARSSVGTASGIAPYLRLLFSRSGSPCAGYSPAYSPNDPRGMCMECSGLGYVDDIDLHELIDPNRSLNEGAIRFPAFEPGTYRWKRLVCSGISDPDTPWKDLPDASRELLLYGQGVRLEHPLVGYPKHGVFDGVIPRLKASYLEKTNVKTTDKEDAALRRIVKRVTCAHCRGQRINDAARASRINGRNIAEVSHMSINECIDFIAAISEETTAAPRQAVLTKLNNMRDIGLNYLSLDRPTDTLSGGEAQRLRLVSLLDTPITDATFVLDEPSSGLHPADIERLLRSLRKLRDAGNTVLIVEHNLHMLAACDRVIELGPGAGDDGGRVLFSGSPGLLARSDTPTGKALRAPVQLNRPASPAGDIVEVTHARCNNLDDVSVSFPTGAITVVSGVAGSGKSSLARAVAQQHSQVTIVDQLPLAASSRSSVLTALGLETPIRRVFSRKSGLTTSWFSSYGKGACPLCQGRGMIRVDMAFMDDVHIPCERCGGRRFNDTAMAVRLDLGSQSFTIADVLDSTLTQVGELFADQEKVLAVVSLLEHVGLGYLTLGRTLNTLSGGELGRVKLVRFLTEHWEKMNGILVLDEMTTGLHSQDVQQLVHFLRQLTARGLTILAIDHNLRLISQADYNIDIGPGAGTEGGTVVFAGTPWGLAHCPTSATGKWLRASTSFGCGRVQAV